MKGKRKFFSKLGVYLLSFSFYLCYNYYGDDMEDMTSIASVNSLKDIDKINDNTKYINIPISNCDTSITDYFLVNGKDYSYTDIIDGKNGFIYCSYDMFKNGEVIVDSIINNMMNDLSDLEKVRYIYITLGKLLGVDINSLACKNEVVSFAMISYLNNVWGALAKGKVQELSLCKIFVYVCSRAGIKCEIVTSGINGSTANKVFVGDNYIIVNLFKDIANIKGMFKTEYFDKYNDDMKLDKKIGYIKDNYMDYYLDNIFKNIDYKRGDILYQVLLITESIINVDVIESYELMEIYNKIFSKYLSNYDISVNNFYVNGSDGREHFVTFRDHDIYYSYNYKRKCFIKIDYDFLVDNLRNKSIGLYCDEDFCMVKGRS